MTDLVKVDTDEQFVQTAMEVGKIVAQSGYFTAIANVPQAVAKILRGRELGVPPITAIENVYIVNGRTALHAGLIASLIKQSGKYNYRVVEQTDKSCTLKFYENGAEIGESRYTIEEAQRAGLVKEGSVWAKYPSDMLFARALTRGARRFTPDVFQGSIYTPEELASSVDMPEEVDGVIEGEVSYPDQETESTKQEIVGKIERAWAWLQKKTGLYTAAQHRWRSIESVCGAQDKYNIPDNILPTDRIRRFFDVATIEDLTAYLQHLKTKRDSIIEKGGETNGNGDTAEAAESCTSTEEQQTTN